MQTVTLRRTGLKMSRLGFGTGTHGWNGSSEQTRIGHQNLVNLIKLGYKHGITFWDSADGYGSHPHIADSLEGIDRSSVGSGQRLEACIFGRVEPNLDAGGGPYLYDSGVSQSPLD